ncbi:hypothetical protein LEMLEM_LOCUS12176 [Lemmus lemmus]
MKETFLNLISIEKALEEYIEEDSKDLNRNMGIQRIEKDHGYECHTECDKNQQPNPEIIINKDTPSRVRAHETPLHICVRMIKSSGLLVNICYSTARDWSL